MKRILLILGTILIMTLLPPAALAYDSGGETYNDHDYNANSMDTDPPQAEETRIIQE